VFVTEDLRKWGTNIKFFNDLFIYNVLSATKFINDLIRTQGYKFDVACIHDWLSSIAGNIIKNETDIPVVFHVHSTEWGRSLGQGSEVVSHLETQMAQRADRIITVSHTMRDDLVRHGWPESKISVVWNGVDPVRYNPEMSQKQHASGIRKKHGIPTEGYLLLFLGRLTWVKGVRNLVQAMPTVLRTYPKAKLIILGKGEEQRDIMETAERLGIQKNVESVFTFVSEDERISYYAAADACIFPSIYEPFGIVSLEAMAMAKPIVVGAQGTVGFREQVIPSGDYQTGVHVNGNNPIDIAWGINEILSDASRAKKWGEHGRERILKYFTWEKVAKQTSDIYTSLLHSKH
jgi:glycosyltransferase involved in cell wall biosynthesis